MSKIARRWVRTFVAAAGLTGGCLLALSAFDSDPAAAADRQPLRAVVDRAERTVDRVLDRPAEPEYPPRVLPRHHRPPVDCEDPDERPRPREARPRPVPPVEPPLEPEPDDQDPAEPAPSPSVPPPAPEPARPREPIIDVPPVDVPPIVIDVPAVPVPPIVVDLPPLLPVTSPPAPPSVEPTPVEPTPVEPAPPAPPATPRPVRPAPVAPPVEFDPADVATPRAGPSGRARTDREPEQDRVKPCERGIVVRQGPRIQPKPTTSTATRKPGKCPGPGHGSWTDGQPPGTLKPPTGAPELPCLAATVATDDDTLARVTVARARAHLSGRGIAALDPRPA